MVSPRPQDDDHGSSDTNKNAEASAAVAGEKHSIEIDGANASPNAKRTKKSDDATRQTTLEETFDNTTKKEADESEKKPSEAAETNMRGEGAAGSDGKKEVPKVKGNKTEEESPKTRKEGVADTEMKDAEEAIFESNDVAKGAKEAKDDTEIPKKTEEPITEETKDKKDTKDPETERLHAATTGAGEMEHEKNNVPSNILEKGIIYFFFRARVNTDKPEEVDDIARSYIILRPLATDSKLGDGPIGDAGNTRLLAIPKKVLPKSEEDRFMTFVEKAEASFPELKEQFLSAGENKTSAGTSHVPAATPLGEGVYVITTTGRESHLAYKLTLPSDLGEVQNEVGLKEQGSFILSTKNPKFPGPAYARLPEAPDFTEKIKEDFRDLRWMPSKPEHLDFPNAQILMIGEIGIEDATKPRKKDIKEGKDEPKDVLDELEDEDTKRMKHLAGDDSDAIFADLQARAKDYPKLQTTF